MFLTGQLFLRKHWQFPRPSFLQTAFLFNTLRSRQNGRHFADDTFKRIFMNENVWIYIKIALKFVPKGTINNIPALVQIMAWRRPGDKPLSEPMMVRLPTHICSRPQWVKAHIIVCSSKKPKCYKRITCVWLIMLHVFPNHLYTHFNAYSDLHPLFGKLRHVQGKWFSTKYSVCIYLLITL